MKAIIIPAELNIGILLIFCAAILAVKIYIHFWWKETEPCPACYGAMDKEKKICVICAEKEAADAAERDLRDY